jgi:hypothetical protein
MNERIILILLSCLLIFSLLFSACFQSSDVNERLAALEKRNQELQQKLDRTADINEIKNLMARYQYYQWARMFDEQVTLYAQKTKDVKAELEGMGVFEGIAGIKKIADMDPSIAAGGAGFMTVNTLTTPMVVVAGDGKTAKGIWISPGVNTSVSNGKASAGWRWARFGVDFIKEDGAWKIWHMHVYGMFRADYYKSWAEVEERPKMPEGAAPQGMPGGPSSQGSNGGPDKANTYSWSYSPTVKTENVPAPPEPYETWDDLMSYVK